MKLTDLCETPLVGRNDWNDEGYVIFEGLLDDPVLSDYEYEWLSVHGSQRGEAVNWQGWLDCTPYFRYSALRRLCCDPRLATALESVTGEPMAVHLNLTPWVSTERDWHSDQILNPPAVGDHYAAVWIALQDIHPDSGPFQFIPGSHRWPQVNQSKLRACLTDDENADPLWPRHAERILTPLFEAYINEREMEEEIVSYFPKRGDCMIWHPRLVHRGSKPNIPGMERRAVISHYSSLDRADMPFPAVQHEAGGWFFPW